jgi:hypothetical protein
MLYNLLIALKIENRQPLSHVTVLTPDEQLVARDIEEALVYIRRYACTNKQILKMIEDEASTVSWVLCGYLYDRTHTVVSSAASVGANFSSRARY